MSVIVGVTGIVKGNDKDKELITGEWYLRALARIGAVSASLYSGSNVKSVAQSMDSLLLTGGGDVDPRRYNEENLYSEGINEERDEFEIALCREMARLGKPILGICRGIQSICVAMGGTLYQDINEKSGMGHKYDTVHGICIEPDTMLYGVFGSGANVNSFHHQAVKSLPEGFRVSARAQDGIIEGMECAQRRIYAVQFHPERMFTQCPAMLGIFKCLTR